jgi:HEAT repeat protein
LCQGCCGKELGEKANASSEAIKGLLMALHDENSCVRFYVAQALGNIGRASPEVINELIAALSDQDDWVKRSAALALAKMSKAGLELINGLFKVLHSKDETLVRQYVTDMLIKTGNNSPELINNLRAGANELEKPAGRRVPLPKKGISPNN